MIEIEHRVMRLLGWYPAGPLKTDADCLGSREVETGERLHDLVKFVAREGGVRCVKVRDLTLIG